MKPVYSAEAEEYRNVVKTFLSNNLPKDWAGMGKLNEKEFNEFVLQWRKKLSTTTFLAPTWPKKYGGADASPMEHVIIAEEFTKAGVPMGSINDSMSIRMLGNTLLLLGTEAQKEYYLPKIISGEHVWSQGFSEPNAGSDLANISLSAKKYGDAWILNGQKIWTSSAMTSNHIMTLARTDSTMGRHKGLTFFLVDMNQPGLEVRPINMLSGYKEFNEVFYRDVVVKEEEILGEINNGWAVAMTLLGHERGGNASVLPILLEEEIQKLIRLAQQNKTNLSPIIRDSLAACYSKVQILKWSGLRTLSKYLHGAQLGPESAIAKLAWSEYHQEVLELSTEILGAEAMILEGRKPSNLLITDDIGSENSSMSWIMTFLNARSEIIYAGSSEIQRNIIAEKVLGLPK
jgi:alkylation response protein AidB-like acyl-CoA dehydrogenase